jgi:hypothetical protein
MAKKTPSTGAKRAPNETHEIATRGAPRRGTRATKSQPPIVVEMEMVHRILAILDHSLRSADEGPRYSSRGELIWGSRDSVVSLDEVFEVETYFKDIIAARALENAVAAELMKRENRPFAATQAGKGERQ